MSLCHKAILYACLSALQHSTAALGVVLAEAISLRLVRQSSIIIGAQ